MDANDLLMGGGVKPAAFPEKQYGTTVSGPIIRQPEVRQQTDFDDGTPKTFPNGDPMLQIVVHVQTELRDASDANDDGVRAFYLKAQMMQAVRDAVKAAGAKGLEVGGHLSIQYVRDEPNSRGRGKEKKIYTATYRAPQAQAANDMLMGAQAPPAPTPTPAVTPSVAVVPDPPAGVDPAVWARMDVNQRQAVLAAMGQTPPF